MGLHKRLYRLRGRCNTQCRAGAKAALVFHRMTNVVKARAAVRRRPAAIHMKWLSTHSTHSTLQHTQQPYIATCNSNVAAVKMLQLLGSCYDSDQQYKQVKASEIQLMRVSCISQNAMAGACDAVQMHVSYQQLHVRAHLV